MGIANSVDTAAQLSKKALFRPVDSHNSNGKAAEMERLLEEGINAMEIGPQGMGGKASVLGVNIENAVRHTATLGVGVSLSCWTHRRGDIVFDRNLSFKTGTHSGFTYGTVEQKGSGVK